MRTEAEKLLYEAIVELAYVQAASPVCESLLCASSKGAEIIQRGKDLLGVKDLGADELS